MHKIFKILVLTIFINSTFTVIFINSAFAVYEEYRGTDTIGEASLEVMQEANLISIANFMRKNRTIDGSHISELCRMHTKAYLNGKEGFILESILKENKLDIESFKDVGFVNVDCGSENFIAHAMEENFNTFTSWIEYGINMNRPIIYRGLVGTPLDIAFYMIEKNPERLGHWRSIASTLLRNGFKKCKDLKIKCSIDLN
ncbi:hypothetical protein [Shewanella sp. SR44-3]|uniref:hypothetical protein n=1 Tax=Shewanella sp. SR44-3 TaxID=2760936 RepID=UPI0015FACB1A|nr:hypothetical protein [Shewanella sp. SR44-3]MBB1270910.1 hypothetical protein [Shewanella sp. SR44-3]